MDGLGGELLLSISPNKLRPPDNGFGVTFGVTLGEAGVIGGEDDLSECAGMVGTEAFSGDNGKEEACTGGIRIAGLVHVCPFLG